MLHDDRDSLTDSACEIPKFGCDSTPRNDDDNLTFPSEAEELLRHLKIGTPKPTLLSAAPTIAEFPRIPNYEIECEIGRGGMGVVYKARHVALNRTDAVKMILATAHAAPSEVARFMAEAEAIAAVKHPNVVQVHDLGNSDGRPYFVMEYIEGGNLAALLKSNGALAPRVTAELIAAVACGVQAAHDAGIVHRDLKPANILLSVSSGQRTADSEDTKAGSSLPTANHLLPTPKVSDFGLAKRLTSDLTRSQAVMGTPAYMAPEQAGKAKFVGPAADVYALGVILYECLTGKVPFDSPDAWSLIRQVLEDIPESPRTFAPHVPRDLELICLKCLEKEPHHRYPTAAALADDLNRFLRGEAVSVRPIGVITRGTRWAKRNPAPAALVVLIALLLLVVPPLAVWQQGRLDRRGAVAEEAERARVEENKARIAAEQLAAARELFALQTKLRNRAAARPPGWTRTTLDELQNGAKLCDADVFRELRSIAAIALTAPDLTPLESMFKAQIMEDGSRREGFTAATAATDPRTGLIALGENLAWGSLSVRLIDPATGQIARKLTFTAGLVRNADGSLRVAPDAIRSLAFSADGSRLFVGTRSSMIVRFDLDELQNTPAKTWTASKLTVEQLAVSPNGKIVYGSCRPEVPIFAWSADSGKLITKLTPQEKDRNFSAFAVLPSGEVVAGHETRLYRWSAEHKLLGHVEKGVGLRLVPTDSSLLICALGGQLELLDCDGFEPTNRFLDPNLRTTAHDEAVRSIAIHPSGAYVATSAGDRVRAVKVWELPSGRLIGKVSSPGTTPIALAWSGDGRYLVATGAEQVARWRFTVSEVERFACLNANAIEAATFMSNGQLASLGEARNGKRELNIELTRNRKFACSLPEPGGKGRVGIAGSPDGALVATFDVHGVLHWKPGTEIPPLKFTQQNARCARVSPDGKTLWAVVNSQEIHAFNLATQKLDAKWDNSTEEFLSGLSMLDALAVGRNVVAAGCANGSVYVLDPATSKVATHFANVGDPVLSVAIMPDDSLIVAGTQKGQLRVLNPATKTETSLAAHADETTAVALSRDGTLLASGGRDRAVQLWKRVGERFEPLFTVSDLPGAVRELQFSPTDGRLLVLLAHAHAVRVWDITKLRTQLTELKLGW